MAHNKHKTDIVAYLTLIGWLIAYFRGDRSASRFHLNQALSILLADLGVNIVFAIATYTNPAPVALMVRGMCGRLGFGILILWVLGLIRAIRGDERPVPVLGEVQILKN